MEIQELYSKFMEVVEKYGFKEESLATEISNYLAKQKVVNASTFAVDFAMEESDASVFLAFLERGLDFYSMTRG
ncbi:hypothetical protein JXM83_01205 [Candidatus Woesearchaeota archaeon]|nr:hypothetical protein [Candidatus Woesearchaeota archaeon]